jgi:hypothetical protein
VRLDGHLIERGCKVDVGSSEPAVSNGFGLLSTEKGIHCEADTACHRAITGQNQFISFTRQDFGFYRAKSAKHAKNTSSVFA